MREGKDLLVTGPATIGRKPGVRGVLVDREDPWGATSLVPSWDQWRAVRRRSSGGVATAASLTATARSLYVTSRVLRLESRQLRHRSHPYLFVPGAPVIDVVGAPAIRRPRDRRPIEDLFERYRLDHDRALRNELVERHLHLVDLHVRRMSHTHHDVEDLRQAAFVGLIGAVERFDPTRGIQFSTFAGRTIEGHLKRYLRDFTWSLRPPRGTQEIAVALSETDRRLSQSLGRRPTVAELAEVLDVDPARVVEAIDARGVRRATSLDGLEAAGVPNSAPYSTERGFGQVEASMTVARLLEHLTERERELIHLRFDDGWTETAIAERFGVSQSYLSRQLKSLLAKMRALADLN